MLKIRDQFDPIDDRLGVVIWLQARKSLFAMVMGACAVVGVALNVAMHGPWQPPQAASGAATHPATALALIALAVAMFRTPFADRGAPGATGLTAAAGLIAVAWTVLGAMGLDPLAMVLPVRGRMSVDTGGAIVLLSLAIGLRYRAPCTGIACLVGLLAIVLNTLLSMTFGVRHFGGLMAGMTLAALCSGAVCAIALHAVHPVVRIIMLTSQVGVRTRVMAAVGTCIPWLAGMFLYRIWGVPRQGFQIEAVVIAIVIATTILLSIASGFQHQIADEMRRSVEKRLAEQAVTDGLTGLRNRVGLMQILRRRMSELRTTGKAACVVIFDLDHFKTINDTHGHDEGDRVLRNVARALPPLLRQGDVLGRWGGEEFMLIADARQEEELKQLVERLRVAICDLSRQTAAHCQTGPFNISASFGVSALRETDTSFEQAIKRADLALYKAKDGGRNCVAFALAYDKAA
ncbi:GGDEF domain-containing protein [Loktanella sp. M215]|uniref:GGDEF domain-containing protein n=1 Tax=Loktanella sp. M215 TaxID=2675431 RepID=UPI001F3EF2E7|nr:GGDEF domain-containing protein [Loktanella sp. M215]MCF7700468.1 diguanylate cyclase [Loktanella sp. M215]